MSIILLNEDLENGVVFNAKAPPSNNVFSATNGGNPGQAHYASIDFNINGTTIITTGVNGVGAGELQGPGQDWFDRGSVLGDEGAAAAAWYWHWQDFSSQCTYSGGDPGTIFSPYGSGWGTGGNNGMGFQVSCNAGEWGQISATVYITDSPLEYPGNGTLIATFGISVSAGDQF